MRSRYEAHTPPATPTTCGGPGIRAPGRRLRRPIPTWTGSGWRSSTWSPAAAGDSDGEVEFRAYYRSTDPDLPGTRVLHERSRFTVRAGRWFYLDDGMDPD